MTGESKATKSHEIIREWARERGGHPTVVKGTENIDHGGLLRFDFGEPEESLERISWEQFFAIFEEKNLTFLYQETTADGQQSRFFKFIDDEGVG